MDFSKSPFVFPPRYPLLSILVFLLDDEAT